jgi:hypothetical protein
VNSDQILRSVVAVRASIPEDAFTAAGLGTKREGSGVIVGKDGLVLTIGYLITEAEEVWLTTHDGRVVPAHALAYDQESGFGLVQALEHLDLPALEFGSAKAAQIGDAVVLADGSGEAVRASIVAKQEFAGYWEYLIDEAIFTAPAHPSWGGAPLVGPSTPEALGQLAERGVRFRAQVTSIGVGTESDELTLNALAVRSSGRLYHLTDPKEMTSMLKRELDLLESTVASDAFVEIVPAPGVQVLAADGIRTEWGQGGALKIPLGALFGGQHREALVRIKVRDGGAIQEGTQSKPLASVRLHFRDPGEGDLERIQETIARVAWTNDPSVVLAHANAKTKSIIAVQDAAKLQMQSAQQVNQGDFAGADRQLAVAEKKLSDQARDSKDDSERQRLSAAAQNIASSRASTKAAAAAPAAARRPAALKLNAEGMSGMGY